MGNNDSLKSRTLAGLFWMYMERIGAQLISFIVSIVLARLLMPEEYGIIAIVLVFINLCNVFVTGGFGKALVQKKDAEEVDFSSVFYFSFVFSLALYALLFFTAPLVARFYEMPLLSPVIRVMGIRLVISSFNTVQHARVTKSMQFKKYFFSTLGGTLCSAAVGIALAYSGAGVWALVAQYLTNTTIDTLVLFVTVRWRPKLLFSFSRLKVLLGFGWKILVGGLVDTLYEDFRSLYVGKLYTASDLAYYSRGQSYTSLIVTNVNSSISSVLFPVISKIQKSKDSVRMVTRRAIKTSAYVLTPMLMGLIVVAEPVVLLLLTEKWLPCVPYLQILCINGALIPIHTANVQAMNAVGRSDITLKLNIAKKAFGFTMVLVFARISVLAMTLAGLATALVSLILNTAPNKKLFEYGFFRQVGDILPYWLMSGVMMLCVFAVSFLPIANVFLMLMLQILVGAAVYFLQSILFKVESFFYILNTVKSILKRGKTPAPSAE